MFTTLLLASAESGKEKTANRIRPVVDFMRGKVITKIRIANCEMRIGEQKSSHPHLDPLPNKGEEEEERVRSAVASQQLNVSTAQLLAVGFLRFGFRVVGTGCAIEAAPFQ